MTTTILENQVLYIRTAPSLTVAESVLRSLLSQGIEVRRWTVALEESGQASRLTVEYKGNRSQVLAAIQIHSEVHSFEIPDASDSIEMELALVRVLASGKVLDEAAEIVGSAGGRLLSLSAEGFSAQVSGRPEKIETMLNRLQSIAPAEIVRSGRLVVGK